MSPKCYQCIDANDAVVRRHGCVKSRQRSGRGFNSQQVHSDYFCYLSPFQWLFSSFRPPVVPEQNL